VEFRNAIEEAIEALVLDGADPAETAVDLQAQADEAIAAYNERVPE
jgi:hypothetical protein